MENKLALLLKSTSTKATQICQFSAVDKTFISKYCNHRNLQPTSIHYLAIKKFFQQIKLEETCDFLNCNKKDFTTAYDLFFKSESSQKSFFKTTQCDIYFLISNFRYLKQLFNNSFELFAEFIKKTLMKQTVYFYFIPTDDLFLSNFILYFSGDIIARNIHLVQVHSSITFNIIYAKSKSILYQHFYKGKFVPIIKEGLLQSEKAMINHFLDDLHYSGKYLFNQIKGHLSPLLTNDILYNLETAKEVLFLVSHPHYSCMSFSLLQDVLSHNFVDTTLQSKLNLILQTKDFASKLTIFCSKKEFVDLLDTKEIVCDGISMYTGKKTVFTIRHYLTYLQDLLAKLKRKEIKLFFLDQEFLVYYSLFNNLLIIYHRYFNPPPSVLYLTDKEDIINILHHTTKLLKKKSTLEESIAFIENIIYHFKIIHNLNSL